MRSLPNRPFTVRQAKDAGIDYQELLQLQRNQEIRRELHGVYSSNDVEDSTLNRAIAAGLASRDHLVVCDRTAAWVYGVDRFAHSAGTARPPIDVVAIDGANRTRRKGTYGGRRTLIDEDIIEMEGTKFTTPVRTAADLACTHGRMDAMATLDMFRRLAGVTPAELEKILPRFAGRRGVIQLRELVPLTIATAESPPESWVRILIIDDGLAPPVSQFWVYDGDCPIFRLDLSYPELKIAIEFDGADFHSDPAQRARDRRRRTWLAAEGWFVVVIRKEDLTYNARRGWLDDLRNVITQRTPAKRRRYARGGQCTQSAFQPVRAD